MNFLLYSILPIRRTKTTPAQGLFWIQTRPTVRLGIGLKPVIMVIVSRRELNTLKTIVRERDPHAIVTVADVTEAFGEGFKDISA